jgi:hypothetical protein
MRGFQNWLQDVDKSNIRVLCGNVLHNKNTEKQIL